MPVGIIAGTGFQKILVDQLSPQNEHTPYGDVPVYTGVIDDQELVFIARHGIDHTIPPHMINYRANIRAMKQLGVERIMATFAVGSLHRGIPAPSLVALTQFMDFTSGREQTFFKGGDSGLVHIEVNEPYCPDLRRKVVEVGAQQGLDIRPEGCYVCTNGPRFETPAEVKMYSALGGDVVGMTGVPEAPLARELGIHYAAVALSINLGAGLQDEIVVIDNLEPLKEKLLDVFLETLENAVTDKSPCESSRFVTHEPSKEFKI